MKNFCLITLVLILSAGISYGQKNSSRIKHKHIPDINSNRNAQYNSEGINLADFTGNAEPINITTNYDYFSDDIITDQIAYYEGIQQFANMIRPFPGSPDPLIRQIAYSYWDGSSYQHISVFGGLAASPQIDVALTGDHSGVTGIAGTPGSGSSLAIYDGAGGFTVSEFGPQPNPSFQFAGNKIFLATAGTEFEFFESDDMGATFTKWSKISDFSYSIYWTNNGCSKVNLFKSPDENIIVYAGTAYGDGNVFEGIPEDQADNLWQIYSTDKGTSWTVESFGFNGKINLVSGYHTPNFAPLLVNFSQLDGAVGNNGIIHYVANGYGVVFDDASGTNILKDNYPLLYWNSSIRQWVSISDEAVDTIQAIGDFYPGNDLGQSYPSIAVSDDGQIIFVTWTAPEITDGQLDINNGYYWTDLYYNWSSDGGATWEGAQILQGGKEVSETFSTAAQRLEDNGDGTYTAHIVWMQDLSAGVNVFGEGDATDNPIMYQSMLIGTVGTQDQGHTVNSFTLDQNYPNPFNPTTSIKYSVAQRGNVSLKVYDLLGNEVATLVNTTKDAGNYEVNFDASNLASGLYIYKIQAGSFVQSKKMMLLK